MIPDSASLAILVAAWFVYFALHSVLASLTVKRWLAARHPDFMPAYRIGFNTIAVLGLLPILWLLYSHPGPVIWGWSGMSAYIANGLALTTMAVNFLVCVSGSTRPEPWKIRSVFISPRPIFLCATRGISSRW
jgi:hypothetical protein